MVLPHKGKLKISHGWTGKGSRWGWELEGAVRGWGERVLKEMTIKGSFSGSGRNQMQGKFPQNYKDDPR